MEKLIIKILLCLVFLSVSLSAQSRAVRADVFADSLRADTSGNKTALNKQADTVYVMHKSPWGAVLRSALLPGWGQVYNRSYWKVPVVWGFIAFYSYYWIDNNRKYRDYINIVTESYDPLSKYFGKTALAETNRDFYRDQRDLFAIYIGLTYALNLLDAYVDAQMFDFSVEEDLRTSSARLSVKLHF